MADEFITADEEKSGQVKFIFAGWCVCVLLILGILLYCKVGNLEKSLQEMILFAVALFPGSILLILTCKCIKIFHAIRTRKILEDKSEKIPVIVEWVTWERLARGFDIGYRVQVSYIYEGHVKVWTSQKYNVDPKSFLSLAGKKSNCTLLVKGHRKMLDRHLHAHNDTRTIKDYYRDPTRPRWVLTRTKRIFFMLVFVFPEIALISGGHSVLPRGYFSLSDKWCLCAFCLFCGAGILGAAYVAWCIMSIKKEKQIAERHWR